MPGKNLDPRGTEQSVQGRSWPRFPVKEYEVWADALNFSSFVAQPTVDTKPEKLDATLESALFYAVA